MLINIVILIIVVYLALIYPNVSSIRKEKMRPYEQKYICHRGLYNNKDVPENSLKAFKLAVENGYGIELDIQITTDNQLVVFHDESLERICGVNKKLNECTFKEIRKLKLLDTDEKIPLFSEVLKVLRPDTPLVIEIKPEGRCLEALDRTVEMMKDYDGLYNIESFNPTVVTSLRHNYPHIIRGQLAYDSIHDPECDLSLVKKIIETYMLCNFLSKPDYIAYECNSYKNLSFQIISRLYKAECIAWTVKSQKQLEELKNLYQCFIFDSFIPDEKTDPE